MARFLAAVLVLLGAFTGARAEEQKYAEFPRDFPLEVSPGAIAIEDMYVRSLAHLGEVPIDKSSGDDAIRFLVLKGNETSLVITLTRYRDFDPGAPEPVFDSALTISYNDNYQDIQRRDGVTHLTSTTESYVADLSPEEFAATIEDLFKKGFFSKPFHYADKRMCADGTAYFVEAKAGTQYNLISRGACYSHLKEDFGDTSLIIKHASNKVPALKEKLDAISTAIKTGDK